MRVVVKKWGNSASVRVRASIMEATNVSLDETVDIREENAGIVLEPIPPAQFDLEQLVAGIAAENVHREMDFGRPVGTEPL